MASPLDLAKPASALPLARPASPSLFSLFSANAAMPLLFSIEGIALLAYATTSATFLPVTPIASIPEDGTWIVK
jgi:hypothetical protein